MRQPERAVGLDQLPNVLVTSLAVEDVESIRSSIKSGASRFGSIDALINNAGFGVTGVFESVAPDKVREQFSVNVLGAMNVIREILPHFRSRRSGIVINMSSGSGVFAVPGASLYCASKFALEGFSEALSYELSDIGVCVKVIEPGGIFSTGFFDRANKEFCATNAPKDYQDFLSRATAFHAGLRRTFGGTEDDVAECIYTALTDGTNQLRYVATKDIEHLIDMRRSTSEEQYMASMRAMFEKSSRERTI